MQSLFNGAVLASLAGHPAKRHLKLKPQLSKKDRPVLLKQANLRNTAEPSRKLL